jgi:hypothetical protein
VGLRRRDARPLVRGGCKNRGLSDAHGIKFLRPAAPRGRCAA